MDIRWWYNAHLFAEKRVDLNRRCIIIVPKHPGHHRNVRATRFKGNHSEGIRGTLKEKMTLSSIANIPLIVGVAFLSKIKHCYSNIYFVKYCKLQDVTFFASRKTTCRTWRRLHKRAKSPYPDLRLYLIPIYCIYLDYLDSGIFNLMKSRNIYKFSSIELSTLYNVFDL